MAAVSTSPLSTSLHCAFRHSLQAILSFYRLTTSCSFRLRALRTGRGCSRARNGDSYGSDWLRKQAFSPVKDLVGVLEEREKREGRGSYEDEEDEWLYWEDKILEDTVPLSGFVRMILHSGQYGSGDKLSSQHERTILERLLPYHPECEKKIGCGIDHLTVGYHPEFEGSRCLFIVRKDGRLVDFSYWKCIKGLIRKNYPVYAECFILKYFRQRRKTY